MMGCGAFSSWIHSISGPVTTLFGMKCQWILEFRVLFQIVAKVGIYFAFDMDTCINCNGFRSRLALFEVTHLIEAKLVVAIGDLLCFAAVLRVTYVPATRRDIPCEDDVNRDRGITKASEDPHRSTDATYQTLRTDR